jgi:hypothetical protein
MPRKFFIYIILLLLNGIFQSAFADSKINSCGVNAKCDPGFYCVGAVGESESGVCVANSLNVVMCRFTQYLQSDIIPYFFLLGAVFAGILLFIGKFAATTFIQIILGMAILLGGVKFIGQLVGPKGLCTTEQALNCADNTEGNLVHKTRYVFNLSPTAVDPKYVDRNESSSEGQNCALLKCFKAKCEEYTRVAVKDQPGKFTCAKGATKVDVENVKKAKVTVCTKAETGTEDLIVSCTPVVGNYLRDYFRCKSCAGQDFAAEAPEIWNVSNCKELIKKQINYSTSSGN